MSLMQKMMLESATNQNTSGLGLPKDFGDVDGFLDLPDFNVGDTASQSSSSQSQSSGGFFSDFNLNGLLDTLLKGGMTWAQIEAAKNGKDVYVQGQGGGQKENITPILISKLQEQAAANQTSVNQMMQIMQQQLAQNNNVPAKKDNTLLYVGIGVGFLVLVGGGLMIISNTKKK